MNTPAHLLIGAAVFGRNAPRSVIWAAFAGAIVPDASLYLMAGTAMFLLNIPPQVVFDDLYFSDAWQTVFAIDNSVLIWGSLFALALRWGPRWSMAFTGAALLHVCLDFPLHHDDGRPHFWPLTDWVFASPVSYWDKDRGASWIAPLEGGAAFCAAMVIWRQKQALAIGAVPGICLLAELWILR